LAVALVESLCWSRQGAPAAFRIIAAMLGLAGPIALGAMAGNVRAGMVAAIGGLALSGRGESETVAEQASSLFRAFMAGAAAMCLGTALAGHGLLTGIGVTAAAALAAVAGGISPGAARDTTQFILFVIIATSIGEQGVRPLGATLLYVLGAAWTAGLLMGLRPLFRRARRPAVSGAAAIPARPRKPSFTASFRRWVMTLGHWSGWQYTLRITSCLAIAEVLAWIWPLEHGYWIALTVAIIVGRRLPAAPTRALQRGLGTLVGVLLAGLLLMAAPSIWVVIVLVAVLAAARPVLKPANYTAYAAVMTPLVMLLIGLGQTPSLVSLADRLMATVAGCTIALTVGYLIWSRPADGLDGKARGSDSAIDG
jgi:hypothetical protein